MSEASKSDPKKAKKHESKGDKLAGKGKFKEAVAEYRKSEGFDPARVEIYDKLIETQNRINEEDWHEEDFADSMSWTMRRQELLNPRMRLVHETFSTEYREVTRLIQTLMAAPDEELESQIIDSILTYGEKAGLPLIHFMLSIKSMALKSDEPPIGDAPAPEPS
ncbi:MAG TPA: hypothetical protein VFW62_02255 [bacterium]|nr:hypothetical protein [bacterium]